MQQRTILRSLHVTFVALAVGVALSATGAGTAVADTRPLYLRTFGPQGTLRFELVDHIKTPQYHWPRTLLTYPVRFEAKVQPGQLRLRDVVTGKAVPFQLSAVKLTGGALTFAEVNFFSDLPSGGKRQFELSAGALEAVPSETKLVTESGSYVLDAGRLKVRVPASILAPTAGQRVPGPIMALQRDAAWIGESSISSSKHAVKSVTTEIVENGPLFIKARVAYEFDGGGRYVATVRAVSGYDFVEFFEEMQGLAREDAVFATNSWTGYHPNRRGKIPLGKPQVNTFRGEDPAFDGPTRIEDPTKELLVRMEITPANGGGGRQEVGFADDGAGRELGLFMQDVGKWDDREYAIWVSHDTLLPVFRYADKLLHWDWPLISGTRATGVAYYAPEETERSLNYFRNLYGDSHLDKVKDWVLEYPSSTRRPPADFYPPAKIKNVAEFMTVFEKSSACSTPASGYGCISLRDMYPTLLPGYTRFQADMTPEQRERATALLLFCGYYTSEEANSPMLRMLGGHPNFMSDLKFPLMGISFLFPDHPMAVEWRDQYEKFLDVVGRFNTRPAVPLWESKAGRWTESLATYNWAFLDPALEASRLSIQTDAKNRFAQEWYAKMGDYLLNTVTAPVTLDADKPEWPAGTPLTIENGFHRIHPPQGAHSSKRGSPGRMRKFGEFMAQYRPLLSEYMLWSAQTPPPSPDAPPAKGKKKPAAPKPVETQGPVNRGTNPHLASAKYTGYGIVMRAGVDTPDEISVYLQQVDKGPNYRWGYANQNGSGDIYYYAAGKSFSGHGFEDTGDRHGDDAMYTCNTGVYKDHHYHCIGMNELVRPFYNLGVAQFAELVSQDGPGAYCWPEYRSRSTMLVGTDYIVVYDALDGWSGSRFVWTSNGVYDEMPNILYIKGGGENIVDISSRLKGGSRGTMWDVWKGDRSRMMIVSHKKDVVQMPKKRGEKNPYVHLKTADSEDWVFQNDEWQEEEPINYSEAGMTFKGRAGVIRQRTNQMCELALFHGTAIGAKGVTVTVDGADLGVSLAFATPAAIKGACFGRQGGSMILAFADAQAARGAFYVDGAKIPATPTASGLSVKLPPGEHRWELTAKQPEPPQPVMLRTENRNGGAKLFFTTVAGAQKYRVELSRDSGTTWQAVTETVKGEAELTRLANGTKVHVRAVALNADQASRPANEYPVYITDKAPLPPDGLKTDISAKQPKLTWGEVLGVTEYRLYRRELGQGVFSEVFRGLANEYVDKGITVPAGFPEPGVRANLLRDTSSCKVYEYAVAAVNGNGESAKCVPVDTDPQSWRNWNPATDLRFKRRTGYWRWPYVKPEEQPPLHYPSAESPNGE